jgi:membrane protein YdbS with pleckstrin-like domain
MEKTLKPDRKYIVAIRWIHFTIFGSLVLTAAIINLIIYLAGDDPEARTIIWLVFLGLCILLWIVVYPLVLLWVRTLSYHIGNERITIYKGIITKTQQNIPYRAVTDFALKRGPYDRILGIGSIKIQTAGQSPQGTGYEGSLSGLIHFDETLAELRAKLKVLHPASEALSNAEIPLKTDEDILREILKEIQQIKGILNKKD